MKTKIWFYQTVDKSRITPKIFGRLTFRSLALLQSELGLGIRCDQGLTPETSAFRKSFTVVIWLLSTPLMKPNF